MLCEAMYAVSGLTVLIYGIEWILTLFDDPREPPRVRSSIPLIGHLVGMTQNGSSYFSQTSKQTQAEIYTISILNHKFYVSNTTRLIPLIQKSSKTLSFRPFIQVAAKVFGDASPMTFELFGTDLVDNYAHVMRNSLAPGSHLDAQNLRMGKRAIVDVDKLLIKNEIQLLHWVRHATVQASSCGIYGERHPMRDSAVEAAFWKWHEYMPFHMVGLDPTGKGYAARNIVYEAYREYLTELPSDAAQVIWERQRVSKEAGIVEGDSHKIEAIFGIAVFPNTAPTMFWALWELFSRPDILEEVRNELINNAISGSTQSGFTVDVAALKQRCPLLLSVLQETQRMKLVHAITRTVISDTLLDGKYMLKAGSYLHMPGNPIHMDQNLWGETANIFDPYRFVAKASQDDKPSIAQNSYAAWGAAPHLCPARQFATTEILILLALLAMRVDLEPVATGKWEALQTRKDSLEAVQSPMKDVTVRVVPRKHWLGTWNLMMGESKTRVSLASG